MSARQWSAWMGLCCAGLFAHFGGLPIQSVVAWTGAVVIAAFDGRKVIP